MSETTFYSTAEDCYLVSANSNWNTAHDAVSATGVTKTATILNIETHYEGTAFEIYRTFLPFDTSGLPDGDTISAALIYLFEGSTSYDDDADGNDWITIVQGLGSDPTNYVAADFDLCGDAIDNPTEGVDVAQRKSLSGIANVVFTLNATGRGWISKTSITQFGIREGHDVVDDPITSGAGNKYNIYRPYSSEQTGTASDPKLVVTHASSGNIKKLNNIAFSNLKKVNNILIANIKKINGITA